MSKPTSIDKRLARLSFQKASAASVRLLCFGTAQSISSWDQQPFVKKLAEELAHDDLIELAVSARRMAECCQRYDIAKSIGISLLFPIQTSPSRWKFVDLQDKVDPNKINLWDLFGRIVHSRSFKVISDDFGIKLLLGNAGVGLMEKLQNAQFAERFPPVLFLSTDRSPLLFLSIESVAKTVVEYLSEMIELFSDEYDLFLENE